MICWPFVSRAEHSALQKRHEDHVRESARVVQMTLQEVRAERDRYDALLEKYHALKLAGATEPAPLPQRPVKERDVCVDAINEVAGGNTAKRMAMLAQLRRDRIAGMDETEILMRIQDGTPLYLDGVPG